MTAPDLDPTSTGATIDAWLAAYADPDPDARAAVVAAVWNAAGRLTDPPFAGAGHAEIAALGAGVVEHYPGHTFRRTTAIDIHHTYGRYGWVLVAGDGTVAAAGEDVAELDADGRLNAVVGFFGTPAELG